MDIGTKHQGTYDYQYSLDKHDTHAIARYIRIGESMTGSDRIYVNLIIDMEKFKYSHPAVKLVGPPIPDNRLNEMHLYIGLSNTRMYHNSLFTISVKQWCSSSDVKDLLKFQGSMKLFMLKSLKGAVCTVAFDKTDRIWKKAQHINRAADTGEVCILRLPGKRLLNKWLDSLNTKEQQKKDTLNNLITSLKTKKQQ